MVVHSLLLSPSEGTNPVALPQRNTPASRIQQQLCSRIFFNSVETSPTLEKGDSRLLIGRGPRRREAQIYGRSLSLYFEGERSKSSEVFDSRKENSFAANLEIQGMKEGK